MMQPSMKYNELDNEDAGMLEDMGGIELQSFGQDSTARGDGSEGEDGNALSSGGPVDIWRWRNAGYLMQYFVVGLIYGGLPATIYGFFLGYLGVPSFVYATAAQIVTLPWAFKFFFGVMNDCVPLWGGYRRKPYMVMGWACCCVTLLALASKALPPPYWCRDNSTGLYITEAADGSPACPCNEAAAEEGGSFAAWMCLAAFGYVISDVAADGLTVEYARREPHGERGATQSTVYLVRTIGSIFATMLVGFGMNGKEYNGTFDATLSFSQICLVFAVPCGIMVPASWFLVEETPVPMGGELSRCARLCAQIRIPVESTAKAGQVGLVEAAAAEGVAGSSEEFDVQVDDGGHGVTIKRLAFRHYLKQCWALLRTKAFFFILLYSFLSAAVGTITTTAQGNVQRYWAGVKNLQNQIFSMVGLGLFALGLWLVKRYFLNASWRKMLLWTTVLLNVVDSFFVFFTIFDVVRNQYFYLGETVLLTIPEAANFLVSTFVIVEMAEDGNEGMVYGLLTTVHNLGFPFARALGNQIYGAFEPPLSDAVNYIADEVSFRSVVAKSFVVSYVFAFSALLLLPLMPDQKAMAQHRKRHWGSHRAYGVITIVIICVAWVYAVTIDFLAMSPDTMCLKIAGGDGCEAEAASEAGDPNCSNVAIFT